MDTLVPTIFNQKFRYLPYLFEFHKNGHLLGCGTLVCCHLATPFMASQPTPLRNKGLIAGLIKEHQY